MLTAIILAGGIGSRVGADCPKQFINVLDKPIIAYTIELYQNNSNVDSIEVVCHKEWKDYLKNIIREYKLTKVKWIVDGGSTFQESVMNGVLYLETKINDNDYILIQYGAAPFTSQKIINDVINVTMKHGSAVSATPCYQLLGTNEGNVSKNWVDRDKYIQIACPYGFKFSYLKSVYTRANEKKLLDVVEPHTTSLMYALGDYIYLAYGDQTNIKITTKEDIELFKCYALMNKYKSNCN